MILLTREGPDPETTNAVNEVFDIVFGNDLKGLYVDFIGVVKSIPNVSQEAAYDLENILILMVRQTIEVTYQK
jgi:hypothetical protein